MIAMRHLLCPTSRAFGMPRPPGRQSPASQGSRFADGADESVVAMSAAVAILYGSAKKGSRRSCGGDLIWFGHSVVPGSANGWICD